MRNMTISSAVLNLSPILKPIATNIRFYPGIWSRGIVLCFILKLSMGDQETLVGKPGGGPLHPDGLVTTRFTLKDQEKHHLRFQN